MDAGDLIEVVAVSKLVLVPYMGENATVHQFIAHLNGFFAGVEVLEHTEQPVCHFVASETFQMHPREPSPVTNFYTEWR